VTALARKKVTIQYRKLEDIEKKLMGTTLQAAVSKALQAKGPKGIIGDDPELRLCTEDPDYGTTVLNFFSDLLCRRQSSGEPDQCTGQLPSLCNLQPADWG
jgi:hypothetical protein